MPKFNLNDLDATGKFLFIASMKVANMIDKQGRNKDYYMKWCSEIWDSMKMSDNDQLDSILNGAIKGDVDRYIKVRMAESNGNCD